MVVQETDQGKIHFMCSKNEFLPGSSYHGDFIFYKLAKAKPPIIYFLIISNSL